MFQFSIHNTGHAWIILCFTGECTYEKRIIYNGTTVKTEEISCDEWTHDKSIFKSTIATEVNDASSSLWWNWGIEHSGRETWTGGEENARKVYQIEESKEREESRESTENEENEESAVSECSEWVSEWVSEWERERERERGMRVWGRNRKGERHRKGGINGEGGRNKETGRQEDREVGRERREMQAFCNAMSGYDVTVPVQGDSSVASFPKIKRELACFAYNLILCSIFHIA